MKEIKIEVSDITYKHLLRLAALDNTECACYGADKATEQTLVNGIVLYAINAEIASGENYWGDYEEDYVIERED